MEKFNDIVVVGQYADHSVIYGSALRRNATLLARRITHNGLNMFESIYEATPIFGQVIREGVGILDRAFYAKFDIKIVPIKRNEDGLVLLEEEGPFIVVARLKTKDLLLGEKVKGINSSCGNVLSDFERNGLKPIKDARQVVDAIKLITEKDISVDVAEVSFKRVGL